MRCRRELQNQQLGECGQLTIGSDGGYASVFMLSFLSIAALLLGTVVGVNLLLAGILEAESHHVQAYWLACGTAAAAERRLRMHEMVQTETLHARIGEVQQSVTAKGTVITVEEAATTMSASFAVQFAFDKHSDTVVSWQEGLSV